MKEKPETIKTKSTKKPRKRVVEIEEAGTKSTLNGTIEIPTSISQDIATLEASIDKKLTTLLEFEQTTPKIAKRNFKAIATYKESKRIIEQEKKPLVAIELKINQADQANDFKTVLNILKTKESVVEKILVKIKPHKAILNELEKEAYPSSIDHVLFKKKYNAINRRIQILEDLYQAKQAVIDSNPALNKNRLTNLENLLNKIKKVIQSDHSKLGSAYKNNPNILTVDQYAAFIDAQNNLTLYETEFQQILKRLDVRLILDQILEQKSALEIIFLEMNKLPSYTTNMEVIEKLKQILSNKDGSFKIGFDNTQFNGDLNTLTPEKKEQLKAHQERIDLAYNQMVACIKKHQASFDLQKENIEFLAKRPMILNAISASTESNPEAFIHLNDAINYQPEQVDNITSGHYFRDLFILSDLAKSSYSEGNLAREHIKTFKNRVPEVHLVDKESGSFYIDKGKEYPLHKDEKAIINTYNTERGILMAAIKNGDNPNEDYKKTVQLLLDKRKTLDIYHSEADKAEINQGLIDSQINSILALRSDITVEQNKIPDSDKAFQDALVSMQTHSDSLLKSLSSDNILKNDELIKEVKVQLEGFKTLYERFSAQVKQAKNLNSILIKMSADIKKETLTITQKYGEEEPRLQILTTMKESIEKKLDEINNISKTLEEMTPTFPFKNTNKICRVATSRCRETAL